MSITKKIGALLGEIISSPTKPSYIIEREGASVVIRRGGDYAGADLAGVVLKGLDLRGTNFQGADLSGVDFSGAHLEGANFVGAKLNGALLSGAHLESSQFDPESLLQATFDATPSGLPIGVITKIKTGDY
jgi:uncharacterized protein YjbI with pentapeptide repeats